MVRSVSTVRRLFFHTLRHASRAATIDVAGYAMAAIVF
jgi:hypothetical protein